MTQLHEHANYIPLKPFAIDVKNYVNLYLPQKNNLKKVIVTLFLAIVTLYLKVVLIS